MKITKAQLRKIITEELARESSRFMGGAIDVDPLSPMEMERDSEAYYELFDFLQDSGLPGNKPSEKLLHALKWVARFEIDSQIVPVEDDALEEGAENLTPENLQVAVEAIKQVIMNFSPAIAAAALGLAYTDMKTSKSKDRSSHYADAEAAAQTRLNKDI
jgi:hypothetical protein